MYEDDETRPASIEEIAAITPERWKELDDLFARSNEESEKINLVPKSKEGEAYISDRYPVFALFTRYELQEIAHTHCNTFLTETEMREVLYAFLDEGWMEVQEALIKAVEFIASNRE
jgi:hypothetical protein